MADNAKQARWIMSLYNNLRCLFAGKSVFVAADFLWYPVEGEPCIRVAPDVMVVLNRPEGDRPFYLQWKEDDVVPQVVFEVLSPSNSQMEMLRKQAFYQNHGVQELILIDPGQKVGDPESFLAYERQGARFCAPDFPPVDWESPTLGSRFRQEEGRVVVFYPDGSPFRDFTEEMEQWQDAESRAKMAEAESEALRQELARLKGKANQ